MSCYFAIMPSKSGQDHTAIGLELLIVALTGVAIFLYGFRQAFRFGSTPSKLRLVVGTVLYLVELVGALWLVAGSIAGLYIAAIATVTNVAFMISAAWLLVVSVYRAGRANITGESISTRSDPTSAPEP
jgi:hypothetical protein